jgi:N-acetylglucosaminylphosphatidylinositol deacetylase
LLLEKLSSSQLLIKKEFQRVMISLGVKFFTIVDDTRLPDGFHSWDLRVLQEILGDVLQKYEDVDTILTFDEGGVSGHPNHISIAKASLSRLPRKPKILQLISIPTLLKFAMPPLEILNPSSSDLVSFVTLCDLSACSDIMKIYSSQDVWFRKLFTLFSRYAYLNTLRIVQ